MRGLIFYKEYPLAISRMS